MNIIECIHCKAKYAIKLHKIPKRQKFLKCSQCQDNTPFPFYSEKEQEFVVMLKATAQKTNKFIATEKDRYQNPNPKAKVEKMNFF